MQFRMVTVRRRGLDANVPRKAPGARPSGFDSQGDVGSRLLRNARAVLADEHASRESSTRRAKSAVVLILQARRNLERACGSNSRPEDFPARIADVRSLIAEACSLSEEVALASASLQRDGRYSIRHAVNVAIACHVVGRIIPLGESLLTSTICAALTMNIGMLQLQDTLHSQLEPLTDGQRKAVREHPATSEALLRSLGVDDEVWLNAVLCHHSALDTNIDVLSSDPEQEAHLAAELICLADVYCARISDRLYRRAVGPSTVLKTFLLERDSQDRSGLTNHFIKAFGAFPPGTAVQLANREIAVVTGRGSKPTSPRVSAVIDPDGMPRSFPTERDTAKPQFAVRKVLEWSALGTTPSMEALWGPVAAMI